MSMMWLNDEDERLRDSVVRSVQNSQNLKDIDWTFVSDELRQNRTAHECMSRWEDIKENGVKGPWGEHEDQLLTSLVSKFGPKKWSHIATYVPGRKGKQCRERWLNHLDPSLKKSAWTDEELNILIEAQSRHGNSWSRIAKLITGRSENAVKNQWNSLMHRHWSKLLKTGDKGGSVSTISGLNKDAPTQGVVSAMKMASTNKKRKEKSRRTKKDEDDDDVAMAVDLPNSSSASDTGIRKKGRVGRPRKKDLPAEELSSGAGVGIGNVSRVGDNKKTFDKSPGKKQSRTHSPVYVRVPISLSQRSEDNGLLRLLYGSIGKSKCIPRIPSNAYLRGGKRRIGRPKKKDRIRAGCPRLVNVPAAWKSGRNYVLEMTNAFINDEVQRSRLFSAVRIKSDELDTALANARMARLRGVLHGNSASHLPLRSPPTVEKALSSSVDMMSIGVDEKRSGPESAIASAALMMLQKQLGTVTPKKMENGKSDKFSQLEVGTDSTTAVDMERLGSTIGSFTPKLAQLDDDQFPMTTALSPLFRNGMSPHAARFRNLTSANASARAKHRMRAGFRAAAESESSKFAGLGVDTSAGASLKRTAMSPLASTLMDLKDNLRDGSITVGEHRRLKMKLIEESRQVGKTRTPENFEGMIKGSGSPLPKRMKGSSGRR